MSGRKLTPSSYPNNSVSSYMFLVHFKLLPLCWSSEGVSLCMGPLRGTPGIPRILHFTQPQYPLLFTSRSFGNFFSWHWFLELGGLTHQGGPIQQRHLSQILLATHGFGASPFRVCPSYQSLYGFLFKSPVVGLPFS